MSDEKVFFDTNILVYFVDGNDTRKQNIAQDLVKRAVQNGNGVISTQSLQEFFNVITKKCLCSKSDAKTLVGMFSEQFPVAQVSVPQFKGPSTFVLSMVFRSGTPLFSPAQMTADALSSIPRI